MDAGELIFTSPEFYAFAVQGLEQEAIRRIKQRAPVNEIEEWISICDDLSGASRDEIESVIFEMLSNSSTTGDTSVFAGEEVSKEDLAPEQTLTTPETNDEENNETSTPRTKQDLFGALPSFPSLGGDVYSSLEKDMGIRIADEEG